MTSRPPCMSVVIPAHDEAAVIDRCLWGLTSGIAPGQLEIIVVPNGCSDDTEDRAKAFAQASAHTISVVPIREASKIAALRAADTVATAFPRAYLDADIEVAGSALLAAAAAMEASGRPSGRPSTQYDVHQSSRLVRRYYRARSAVPGLNRALWGAGLFILSREGRARFEDWPAVTGDDLFVHSLFSRDEMFIHEDSVSVVRVPRDLTSLMAVCVRAHRGKREQLRPHGGGAPTSDSTRATLGGLAHGLLARRVSASDAAVYCAIAIAARFRGRREPSSGWERDASSRVSVS